MQLALEIENLNHWKTQLTSNREGLLLKETGNQTKDIHFCSLKTQIHISQNLKVCFTPMVWLSHSFSFLPIIKHCVKLVTNESGNDLKVGEKIIPHLCDSAFRLMNMTFKDTWCTQRDLNKSERLRWDQHLVHFSKGERSNNPPTPNEVIWDGRPTRPFLFATCILWGQTAVTAGCTEKLAAVNMDGNTQRSTK